MCSVVPVVAIIAFLMLGMKFRSGHRRLLRFLRLLVLLSLSILSELTPPAPITSRISSTRAARLLTVASFDLAGGDAGVTGERLRWRLLASVDSAGVAILGTRGLRMHCMGSFDAFLG